MDQPRCPTKGDFLHPAKLPFSGYSSTNQSGKHMMTESLSSQEKLALITENLQEVLRRDILEDVIVKQNRPLVVYWGKYLVIESAMRIWRSEH